MADIFEGSEATFTPVAGDYIRGVDDPTGTPISGNMTIAQLTTLLNTLIGGGPSTSGNVLTSNGTIWTSAAAAGGGGDWTDATGTWSYSSADAPTFVASVNNDQTAIIYPGQRLSLTQTTEKFFIVTAVGAYSGGATLITMYGGTDYTLAAEAITTPKWSNVKVPSRFPMSPLKWSETFTDTTSRNQNTPTQDAWYNAGSLSKSLPIGVWNVYFKCAVYVTKASTTNVGVYSTLSTTNNTETNVNMTMLSVMTVASANLGSYLASSVSDIIALTSKTTYYPLVKTGAAGIDTIGFYNTYIGMIIRAVCSYL